MVWYEKVLFVVVVVLAGAAFVNLLRPLGHDVPYGLLATVLGILGVVLIRERRRREAERNQ